MTNLSCYKLLCIVTLFPQHLLPQPKTDHADLPKEQDCYFDTPIIKKKKLRTVK